MKAALVTAIIALLVLVVLALATEASASQDCVTPTTYLEKVEAVHPDTYSLEPVFTGRGEITAFLELYPMKSNQFGVPNGFWLLVNTSHDKALVIPSIDGCLLAYRNLDTKPETLALAVHSKGEWAVILKKVEAVMRRSRV